MNESTLDRSAVHPLVLGTNVLGWTVDEPSAYRLLDEFVGAGGSMIDTADAYSYWVDGHEGREAETLIGRWVGRAAGNRERVSIGTKVSMLPAFPGLSRANILAAIDASLQALRTDHVDIYWAHFDDPETPLEETAAAFDEVVRSGKARHIGISNFDGPRIESWLALARENGLIVPAAIQPHYNLLKRGPFEREILPIARTWGLSVFPYFGLASGFLTGKFRTLEEIEASDRADITRDYYSPSALAVIDILTRIGRAHGVTPGAVALSWLASRETVVGPIASARTPDQLAELMVVGELSLSAEEQALLGDVSDNVRLPGDLVV